MISGYSFIRVAAATAQVAQSHSSGSRARSIAAAALSRSVGAIAVKTPYPSKRAAVESTTWYKSVNKSKHSIRQEQPGRASSPDSRQQQQQQQQQGAEAAAVPWFVCFEITGVSINNCFRFGPVWFCFGCKFADAVQRNQWSTVPVMVFRSCAQNTWQMKTTNRSVYRCLRSWRRPRSGA